MYMATAASELFLQSRGVRLSDATVPNEAVHQRGKPSLISLVYLAQRPAQSTPKKLLFLSLAFSDSAWLPQSVVIWSCRSHRRSHPCRAKVCGFRAPFKSCFSRALYCKVAVYRRLQH